MSEFANAFVKPYMESQEKVHKVDSTWDMHAQGMLDAKGNYRCALIDLKHRDIYVKSYLKNGGKYLRVVDTYGSEYAARMKGEL